MSTKTARKPKSTEANPYRVALQQQIASLPELRNDMARAKEALTLAETMVENGDKAPRYTERFQNELNRIQTDINRVMGENPKLLLNTCRDTELRQAWETSRVLRTKAGSALKAEEQLVQGVEERVASLRGRISERRGRPQILNEGQNPDWTADKNGDAFMWAIRGEEILFCARTNNPANITEYTVIWAEVMRDMRLAKASYNDALARYEESQRNYNAARQALIDSPF